MPGTRAYMAAAIAALSMLGVLAAVRPTTAQQPEIVETSSGFVVERVSVRGACVVIISRSERTGSGSSDYLAAVPCGS